MRNLWVALLGSLSFFCMLGAVTGLAVIIMDLINVSGLEGNWIMGVWSLGLFGFSWLAIWVLRVKHDWY